MGFGEDDFKDGGSDRLVDAIVAWGSEEALHERLQAQFKAGADHVNVVALADANADPDNPRPTRRVARAGAGMEAHFGSVARRAGAAPPLPPIGLYVYYRGECLNKSQLLHNSGRKRPWRILS